MVEERPKDGMYSRFTGPVMDQIRGLVSDFADEREATKMYKRLRSLKRFEKLVEAQTALVTVGQRALSDYLPEAVTISTYTYRCTSQPGSHILDLARADANPMELLHLLAHYLQPPTGPWHGGQFGSVFLELIERQFGADTKRAAKDIMVSNKIKTSVRSAATREKQTARFFERKIAKAPEGLARILQEMREMKEES